MAGYQSVIEVHRLEERIDRLGFRMGHPKHGGYSNEYGDQVALFPKDDCMPIYSRDAELYIGTLEGLRVWLDGWEKLQQYHRMLLGKNFEKQVLRKEQDYRNERLMTIVKEGTIDE
jgi:hypothetical protein